MVSKADVAGMAKKGCYTLALAVSCEFATYPKPKRGGRLYAMSSIDSSSAGHKVLKERIVYFDFRQ
jgi:hypothetical protein